MATKILIGSVLKPVDDVRHYQKIAKSLAKKDVEIHIFGYHSNSKSAEKNIIFHPTKPFKRISLGRILAYIQYFFLGLKIKPKVIITCTHELLKTSFYIKLLTRAELIYDVQENYYLNIIHTDAFPKILRYPIAWIVRLNEWLSSTVVDHYFLAEKCYEKELPYLKKDKYTILENKHQTPNIKHQISSIRHQSSNFIITGTLGMHYGTKEGIEFFKKYNKIKPESTLEIVGVCRENSLIDEIRNLKTSNIKHQTSNNEPIPHSEIIKVLENRGVALLPYQPNKSTENRIPTKFYEYLYYKIPMIIQKNEVWEAFLKPYKAAIFIDFNNYNVEDIINQLENFNFYSGKEISEEILWNSEEEKLLRTELIKKL